MIDDYTSDRFGKWKRDIGIDISCWNEDNDALPYPLKIASVMGYTYKELKPSHGTQ